jgi:hypothetical protein
MLLPKRNNIFYTTTALRGGCLLYFYSFVTAVKFIVINTPGFGNSFTPMTVRAGRWLPIIST